MDVTVDDVLHGLRVVAALKLNERPTDMSAPHCRSPRPSGRGRIEAHIEGEKVEFTTAVVAALKPYLDRHGIAVELTFSTAFGSWPH